MLHPAGDFSPVIEVFQTHSDDVLLDTSARLDDRQRTPCSVPRAMCARDIVYCCYIVPIPPDCTNAPNYRRWSKHIR